MKILVTGSSGLVGKALVSELKKRKHNVIEFSLNEGKNILNKEHIKKAIKKVDLVIHLAAIIDINNKNLWKVNVEGTKNIIEESSKERVNKFLFLSSTAVYGHINNLISENSELKPQTIYDKSKYEAEQIVLKHQEELHVNVIRSAMLLGPNNYWKKMFKLLEKNFPLPCPGKNHFQVLYVKELIRAILVVIENGEPGEVYLVAGKEKWSLKEFCKKTKKSLGKKEIVWSVPSLLAILIGKITKNELITKENIKHLCKERKYNLDKINSIGYEQKIPLEKAISETIQNLKEIN